MLTAKLRGRKQKMGLTSHFLKVHLRSPKVTAYLLNYLFTFTNGVAFPNNTVLPAFDAIAIAASR